MIISASILTLLAFFIINLFATRQVIEDADGNPYLIRYFIYRPDWLRHFRIDAKKAGRIYLHHFLRSDYDRALHDHPWNFRTFLLKGGYREWADWRLLIEAEKEASTCPHPNEDTTAQWNIPERIDEDTFPNVYRDFKAPCTMRRGAGWRHRVELQPGKTTWSLVFIGPKVRSWGFFTNLRLNLWCHWKTYNYRTGLCEEN
jgi:hypothetical protein